MSFEVFGVFLAAFIQGIMITIYGANDSCKSTTTLANHLSENSNSTTTLASTTKPNSYNKLVLLIIIIRDD
jgi:hypothetical protein